MPACHTGAAAEFTATLREVDYHLGKLALARGEPAKAEVYLQKSGYKDWNRPITLITRSSEDAATGHTFAPQRIVAIVPGRVYVLTGFESPGSDLKAARPLRMPNGSSISN